MKSINIEEINRKNDAIAPGLTIVYWGDNNQEILDSFKNVKKEFKDLSKYIRWYSKENIHTTISPLTRTRYKKSFPFIANELPENISKITSKIGKIEPIDIVINKVSLRENGQIQLIIDVPKRSENNIQAFRNISKSIDPDFQYLDKPKPINQIQLHINLGYFTKLPKRIIKPFEKKIKNEIKTIISSVSVVHYLKRTLQKKYIVGQIHVPLNQKNHLSNESFQYLLGIN